MFMKFKLQTITKVGRLIPDGYRECAVLPCSQYEQAGIAVLALQIALSILR